jgi:hypothetical protein
MLLHISCNFQCRNNDRIIQYTTNDRITNYLCNEFYTARATEKNELWQGSPKSYKITTHRGRYLGRDLKS